MPEVDHSDRMEVKDALYYPYIHFRDETWLRSSLLFFPHVLRMAPKDYAFRDSKFIRDLMETEGAWGQPLVTTYPLDSYHAYLAANRLAERFERDLQDREFVRRLNREATIASSVTTSCSRFIDQSSRIHCRTRSVKRDSFGGLGKATREVLG